jgi:hypothetical protein
VPVRKEFSANLRGRKGADLYITFVSERPMSKHHGNGRRSLRRGWVAVLTSYTTAGHIEFNVITEMLLDGVDGIILLLRFTHGELKKSKIRANL